MRGRRGGEGWIELSMNTFVLLSLTNKETCFIRDIKIRITIFLRFIRSQDSSKDNNFFLEKRNHSLFRFPTKIFIAYDGSTMVSIRVYIYIYIKFLSYPYLQFYFQISMYHQLSLAIQISSCITKNHNHIRIPFFVIQLSCTSAQVEKKRKVENRVVKSTEKSL